jgi:hypothetical protein
LTWTTTLAPRTRALRTRWSLCQRRPEKSRTSQKHHHADLRCQRSDAAHRAPDPNQALYQFISGYTAKVGGTELDCATSRKSPSRPVSGGPFMVHHPYKYADLLKRKIERYGVTCWLVNTGWVGGPYGVGKRISIRYTRNLLNAALTGKLNERGILPGPGLWL